MIKDLTGPMFYEDDIIRIFRLRDDQDELPLTYWYIVQCKQCGMRSDDIDVRTLSLYKDLLREKSIKKIVPSYERRLFVDYVVPVIIKHSILSGEIRHKSKAGCSEQLFL